LQKNKNYKKTITKKMIHKAILDGYVSSFNYEIRLRNDPLEIPGRYRRKQDRELAAFIAAMFSYGRVSQFKPVVEDVLAVMGKRPAAFLVAFRGVREGAAFSNIGYRFSRSADIVAFLDALAACLRDHGSLEKAFFYHDNPDDRTVGTGLSGLMASLRQQWEKQGLGSGSPSRGFLHLLPTPAGGGAAKRACLFLRWVVRRHDIDLGLWRSVAPSRLVIPLDTHIRRVAQCLGLTRRKSPNWNMAVDITDGLRCMDPEDPLKYDFPLCHLGMGGQCPSRFDIALCQRCSLRSGGGTTAWCPDRASSSRRPSC